MAVKYHPDKNKVSAESTTNFDMYHDEAFTLAQEKGIWVAPYSM